MKISTKTGDDGTTALIGNVRVTKDNSRLEAYGTADELNAHVGLLIEWVPQEEKTILNGLQRKLFDLGTDLATPDEKRKTMHITSQDVVDIENLIEQYEKMLPPMRGFVLPAGGKAAAQAHICRCVARRMERNIYHLHTQYPQPKNILMYVNRLSDLFFLMARKMAINDSGEIFL